MRAGKLIRFPGSQYPIRPAWSGAYPVMRNLLWFEPGMLAIVVDVGEPAGRMLDHQRAGIGVGALELIRALQLYVSVHEQVASTALMPGVVGLATRSGIPDAAPFGHRRQIGV